MRVPCMRPGGQRDITANPNPADAACRVQTSVSHEQCSDYVIIRKCLGTAAFPLYVQESFCTWNESVLLQLERPFTMARFLLFPQDSLFRARSALPRPVHPRPHHGSTAPHSTGPPPISIRVALKRGSLSCTDVGVREHERWWACAGGAD